MKVCFFLMLVFFGLSSFSQKLDSVQQYNVLLRIDLMDFELDYMNVIDTCDKYLNYDFSVCSYEAGLYSFKGEALEYALDTIHFVDDYYEREDYYDSVSDTLINQIISLYQQSISSCKKCELVYYKQKYLFEYSQGVVNKSDFKILKKQGYYGIEDYWSISPSYFYGKEQWIGAEISSNHISHFYFDEDMMALQFVGVGFRKNSTVKKGWGMNFSIASLSWNWINIRPINFTYLHSGENKSLGYSPELGIQFWYLHLNTGYNLAFNKSMRNYENLYFIAKFDIPFYRF